MSLYKRNVTWWSRIEHKGKLYQQSLRTKSKNTAVELEAALKTSLISGQRQIAKACPTLREFEPRFFDHLKLTVKTSSVKFYKYQFATLMQSPLADMKLSLIDASACEEFKQWRVSQGVAVVTTNCSIRCLRRGLHLAEEWRLITRAPRLRLLPNENQREEVVEEHELLEMIKYAALAYPQNVFRFLLPFLADTGLRVSEACALKRYENIFLGDKPFVKVLTGKSKASKREVPLTSRAVTAIKSAFNQSRCTYVFTSRGGRKAIGRSYCSQQFKLVASLVIKRTDALVLHSLRHTFCTRLGESGADAFTIMRLAGHASVTISQRYVHARQSVSRNAIERLEALQKKEPEIEHKSTGQREEV